MKDTEFNKIMEIIVNALRERGYTPYMQLYKDREIAKLLGLKIDTVSKRLERARKQLKKQLNEGGSLK